MYSIVRCKATDCFIFSDTNTLNRWYKKDKIDFRFELLHQIRLALISHGALVVKRRNWNLTDRSIQHIIYTVTPSAVFQKPLQI